MIFSWWAKKHEPFWTAPENLDSHRIGHVWMAPKSAGHLTSCSWRRAKNGGNSVGQFRLNRHTRKAFSFYFTFFKLAKGPDARTLRIIDHLVPQHFDGSARKVPCRQRWKGCCIVAIYIPVNGQKVSRKSVFEISKLAADLTLVQKFNIVVLRLHFLLSDATVSFKFPGIQGRDKVSKRTARQGAWSNTTAIQEYAAAVLHHLLSLRGLPQDLRSGILHQNHHDLHFQLQFVGPSRKIQ